MTARGCFAFFALVWFCLACNARADDSSYFLAAQLQQSVGDVPTASCTTIWSRFENGTSQDWIAFAFVMTVPRTDGAPPCKQALSTSIVAAASKPLAAYDRYFGEPAALSRRYILQLIAGTAYTEFDGLREHLRTSNLILDGRFRLDAKDGEVAILRALLCQPIGSVLADHVFDLAPNVPGWPNHYVADCIDLALRQRFGSGAPMP